MSIPAYQKVIQIKSTSSTSSTAYVQLPATNATLTLAGDLLDDTDISSTGYRSKVIGLKDWNVSAPSNFDSANSALTIARAAWLNRTRVDVQYLPDGTNGYEGTCFVETYTLSGDVGGLETVDISLQADSPLTTV